mgnify:FL=1
MIAFKKQPAIPGTISDGSTGTVERDGQIIGEYIRLERCCPESLYFATIAGHDYSGTKAEIIAACT